VAPHARLLTGNLIDSDARLRSILHAGFRTRRPLGLIEERGECLFLGDVHLFRLREDVCFGRKPEAQRLTQRSIGIAKGYWSHVRPPARGHPHPGTAVPIVKMSFINSVITEARFVPNVPCDEISDAYRPWAEAN
jgi:hypothetical protein